jgi:hypothetical protein
MGELYSEAKKKEVIAFSQKESTKPMKMLLSALCLCALILGHASADDAVTKIVFRSQNPDLASDPIATEPRTLYRMGTTMGRIEEPIDSPPGGTSIFIANGKDGWIINLAGHTGKHLVDPSADQSFYAPIIPPEGPNQPAPVRAFEMGRELAFMRSQFVEPKAVSKDGKKLSLYECTREGYTLQFYLNAETFMPTETDVLKDSKLLTRVIYLEYKTLPADPSLFQPPAGVKISEG